MARKSASLLSAFLIFILLGSGIAAVPMDLEVAERPMTDDALQIEIGQDGTDGSRDGSRAVLVNRLTGNPPTIDGIFALANEWNEAQQVSVGDTVDGDTVELYIAADGETLYVLVDAVDDTDLDPEPAAPACAEYIVMVWDGDNDGTITYDQGEAGSAGVADGGKNADFGIIYWGDGSIWASDVVLDGNSVLFDTSASTNVQIAHTFTSTPNSGTPHRVLEYSIPYDGPNDHLGSSIGYPFTKGFNIQVLENASGTQDIIGQWPSNLASISNSFDTANLPQKFPHILDVISPQEGAVFQQGQDIKFEIDSSDNNDTTLVRKLYLNSNMVSMGNSDVLVKNDLVIGQYDVSFRIEDDEGFNDTADLGLINVVEAASPPVVDSKDPTGDVAIFEGEEQKITVNWHDLNLDQANESVTVTWAVDGEPADLAWINKTSSNSTHHTSELTFKSGFTGDFDAGIYSINFELEDRYFDTFTSVLESWTITVKDVNNEPAITFTEPVAGQLVTVTEEEQATFTVHKSDPDQDILKVKWFIDEVQQNDYNDNDTFIFNADAPDYDLEGEYVVKVTVADGEFTKEAEWDVTVTDVNRAPVWNITQFVPDDTEIEIAEGDNLAFSYKADDPDGDPISYTWFINDVTADQGTGTGTFTFETAYLKADGYDSTNSPYFVKVRVSDGTLFIENEWKVLVENTNRPPIPIIDRPKEGDIFKVDEPVNFKTSSSFDPDGDKLTYTWDFGDRKSSNSPETNHEYKEDGRYAIELEVSDGHISVTTKVNITIAIAVLRLDEMDYSPKPAKEGDIVNISVKVTNIGSTGATNVKIKFFIGVKSPTGSIGEVIIPSIPPGTQEMAMKTWVAKPGNQLLIVAIEESDDYMIQGLNDDQQAVQVKAKSTDPGGSMLDGLLLPLILIVIIIIVIAVVAVAVSKKKKKRHEEDEDAAVKAIIDAKHAPPPKHKAEPASPYDKTDFHFGPVEGESRDCIDCGTDTSNPSGICDNCTFTRREKDEADKLMECPVCGNEVSKDMFTCPYCHFNFSKMDKEEEEEEEVHEPIGYVSDDACADCGVLFNDGMSVIKCPSCEATYHKRCSNRLSTCCECNADLSAGQTKTFKSPAAMIEEEPEPEPEVEPEPEPEPEPILEGPTCPSCGEEIEDDWKVCPNCDHKLGAPPLEKKVEPPKVEPKKIPPPPEEGKCPECGEDIESDWKVCPNCDHRLGAPPPEKKVEPPKVEPRKIPPPPEEGKCPECGEDIESDWKVCPSCDYKLVGPTPEEKAADKKKKRKITWSKRAKEKAKTTPKVIRKVKPVEKKVRPKEEEKDDLKADIEKLMKEIEAAEKDDKVVKKAKSLATLARSFLKGKKPDKAKIYIERAKKELEK